MKWLRDTLLGDSHYQMKMLEINKWAFIESLEEEIC